MLIGKRINNVYLLDISSPTSIGCLLSKHDESWLWHRRIAHIHMNHLNKLISKDLVIGLPKFKFEKDHICVACQKGKRIKHSFKLKNVVSTSKPLELLHMDLFGPLSTMSLGGNYYALVIDYFSRYTWTPFLESKSDVFLHSRSLLEDCRTHVAATLVPLEVITKGSFKMKNLAPFMKRWESFTTSLHQELLNRMEWWKGRTYPLKNLQEPC